MRRMAVVAVVVLVGCGGATTPPGDGGADAGVDAGHATSGPVTGHCNRLHWRTSGQVLVEPQAQAVIIGSWGDDGGFVQHAVTVLDGGEFRCDDAPDGAYFAGVVQGSSTVWVETDVRTLDLDFIGAGPVSASLPNARLEVALDGGLDGGGDLVIWSPDTSSFTEGAIAADGGRAWSFVLVDFPAMGAADVVSWAWAEHTELTGPQGEAHYRSIIGGWTRLVGLPSSPVLDLTLDQPVSASIVVPQAVLQALPVTGPASALRYSTGLFIDASAVVAGRPQQLGPLGLDAPLGQDTAMGMVSPRDVAHQVDAHHPFAADGWATTYTWWASSRAGTAGAHASVTVTSATPPSTFALPFAPPADVRIDGHDALSADGGFASSAPEVSWTGPAGVDGYQVLFLVNGTDVQSSLRTTATHLKLPRGFVRDRGAILVVAEKTPGVSWAPHPPLDDAREASRVSLRSFIWPAPTVP